MRPPGQEKGFTKGSLMSRRQFAQSTAALSLSVLLPRALYSAPASNAQEIMIHTDDQIGVVRPELHGQFAEHLGSCVYGGLWVGKNSPIPNINGYRKAAVEYLRELGIPVLRWPGGCFADDYHWRDGIGPAEKRPKRVNIHWGGYVEDNSFGTHEFIGLCRLLGAQPYFAGNVGSGTPNESGIGSSTAISLREAPSAMNGPRTDRPNPSRCGTGEWVTKTGAAAAP